MPEFVIDEWRKARFGYFDAGRFVEVKPPISIEEAEERHNCRWVGGDLDFELLQAVAPLIRRAALEEAAAWHTQGALLAEREAGYTADPARKDELLRHAAREQKAAAIIRNLGASA